MAYDCLYRADEVTITFGRSILFVLCFVSCTCRKNVQVAIFDFTDSPPNSKSNNKVRRGMKDWKCRRFRPNRIKKNRREGKSENERSVIKLLNHSKMCVVWHGGNREHIETQRIDRVRRKQRCFKSFIITKVWFSVAFFFLKFCFCWCRCWYWIRWAVQCNEFLWWKNKIYSNITGERFTVTSSSSESLFFSSKQSLFLNSSSNVPPVYYIYVSTVCTCACVCVCERWMQVNKTLNV